MVATGIPLPRFIRKGYSSFLIHVKNCCSSQRSRQKCELNDPDGIAVTLGNCYLKATLTLCTGGGGGCGFIALWLGEVDEEEEGIRARIWAD